MPEPAEKEADFRGELKEPKPVVVRREPERDLVVWSAPARPFKRKDRQFYITIFSIAGLVGLVLFLAEGLMPVILLISLVFLYYIMNTIQPETLDYKITTKGVYLAKKVILWNLLSRFWFSRQADSELLNIETLTFPGRIGFVIPIEKKEEIRKALSSYLVEEEVLPSTLDKVVNWFAGKLPGNR